MHTSITITRNAPPQRGLMPSYTITWLIDVLRDYPATASQTETPWVAYHLVEILFQQGYTPASPAAYQSLLKDKDTYIRWWQQDRASFDNFDHFDQTDNPNEDEDHDRIPDPDFDECA